MFVLILRQNLQHFAKFFVSLIDCLITPKCEERVMGDLDVETVPLVVSVPVILERAEDELELILVVVTPLRTKDVEAKEEQ